MLNDAFGRVMQALKTFDSNSKTPRGARILEVNSRVSDIAPSQTVYLAAKVSELERGGAVIHSLAIGEPDFPPPQPVLDAVTKAMVEGKTGYTNVSGIFELRKEICDYLSKYKSVNYLPDHILCTNGAKVRIRFF
jgi:aspartate/methionine/tyrosine aminotransferase